MWLILGIVVAGLLCVLLAWLAIKPASTAGNRTYRYHANKKNFVRIDDDGVAWELTDDEVEYLNTPFYPGDGNRPYVKSRYNSRTPDGRMRGFLEAKHLPRGTKINRN